MTTNRAPNKFESYFKWIISVVVAVLIGLLSSGFKDIDTLKQRITALEIKFEYIQNDLNEIKCDQKEIIKKIEELKEGK